MSIFRLYMRVKLSLEYTSARRNLFLRACGCCDAELFLHEMDQKLKSCGILDYKDSYLEFIFSHSEVLITPEQCATT